MFKIEGFPEDHTTFDADAWFFGIVGRCIIAVVGCLIARGRRALDDTGLRSPMIGLNELRFGVVVLGK